MESRDWTQATIEQRLEHHRQMAEAYYHAYDSQAVAGGETYEKWVFSQDALYWSPYFGDETIDLKANPLSVADSAHMEALTYSLIFPDWKPLGFKCWPSPQGFAMQTHFGGHRPGDPDLHDFYSYGFVDTDEHDHIIRWETHVSSEYNDFLDIAIGCHGPFKNGADEYMNAVFKMLVSKGIDPKDLMGKKDARA